MAEMLKTSGGLRGFHDVRGLEAVRTASKAGVHSKPASATMALVDLYIKMQQRERLLRERPRLVRKLKFLRQEIQEVTRETDRLAQQAMQATQTIRGKRVKQRGSSNEAAGSRNTIHY